MAKPYTCATSDVRLKPAPEQPLLSIVIPTFNRPVELALAVSSIAEQIKDGLERKVEILISDNASSADHQAAIRALSDRFSCVSYYMNAQNEGPGQIALAPWRARCRWHWLFGDDDVLIPGGVSGVVNVLERDAPAFLSLNRCVADNTLENLLTAAKNSLPTTKFDTFLDMMKRIGIDQLSFFTSQIYETNASRQTDATHYVESQSFYSQIAYYLDAFSNLSAMYLEDVYVIHRWQPDDTKKHAANFYHLAATLPPIMAYARDRHGLDKGLFEQVSGEKSASMTPSNGATFVDNILQYLWHCLALGLRMSDQDWAFLETEAANWRPDRREQIAQVRSAQAALDILQHDWTMANAELTAQTSATGMSDALRRLASAQFSAKTASLSAALDAARRSAADAGSRYNS